MTVIQRSPDFELPLNQVATKPPEQRGIQRDGIKLLVARQGTITHTRFRGIGSHVRSGDLIVVNSSPTMPAALSGSIDGTAVIVHLSTPLSDGSWVAELRAVDQSGPVGGVDPGDVVILPGGGTLSVQGHVDLAPSVAQRLWRGQLATSVPALRYLRRYGRPIRYSYIEGSWPLCSYQTMFADLRSNEFGSAEMPSAGRPFTRPLVSNLRSQGVDVGSIKLHTGVSSLESLEPPEPERYSVPVRTAALVGRTKERGGRVIAVGTTVTRALETVAQPDGTIVEGRGWTDLVIGPDRPARVVDGLITGWHQPGASHLSLLESVAGRSMVEAAYDAARSNGYLWHEFGDSCLFLP